MELKWWMNAESNSCLALPPSDLKWRGGGFLLIWALRRDCWNANCMLEKNWRSMHASKTSERAAAPTNFVLVTEPSTTRAGTIWMWRKHGGSLSANHVLTNCKNIMGFGHTARNALCKAHSTPRPTQIVWKTPWSPKLSRKHFPKDENFGANVETGDGPSFCQETKIQTPQ